jgi:hypothetical protein
MNMHMLLSAGIEGVGEILHHFVPLSHESLLKQHINRIFCSDTFLFFFHGGFIGCAREIVLKRDKIESQLSILRPCRGHALKNNLFKDKFVSADTDQSPQIHLDLEQTVTEYYSFPRSKVLNGQEEKDGVLTL